MAQKMVVIPEHVWSFDKEEPVEKRKTIYPTLRKLEGSIQKLLEDTQIDDYEKTKLLTQLQQRYKGIYSTRQPLKMHLETNGKETRQPSEVTIKRKLDLSLSDDDDLIEMMPTLTPINTDNASNREKVHSEIMTALPKYALKKYRKMMDVIESSQTMAYDTQTRALTIDGTAVENTNIVDFVVESLVEKSHLQK